MENAYLQSPCTVRDGNRGGSGKAEIGRPKWYTAGMSSIISRAEMALLEYLSEHSGIAGGRIGLDPKPITRDLRISMNQLALDSASLMAHGLAGVRHARVGADHARSTTVCSAIWVTSKGEEYLKRSQRRAGIAGGSGK